MARIAFVAGEVDRAIDVDRQVGVDLDQAAEVALVPVVAAPRLVGDVLDGEVLVRRQLDVRARALAAGADRGLEHRVELLARNHERAPPGVVPLDERIRFREALLEAIEHGLEVRVRIRRGDRVVERLGLLVEGQPLAFEHPHARAHRRRAAFRGTGGAGVAELVVAATAGTRRRRMRPVSAFTPAPIASSVSFALSASRLMSAGP